jgi:hypothetical protein
MQQLRSHHVIRRHIVNQASTQTMLNYTVIAQNVDIRDCAHANAIPIASAAANHMEVPVRPKVLTLFRIQLREQENERPARRPALIAYRLLPDPLTTPLGLVHLILQAFTETVQPTASGPQGLQCPGQARHINLPLFSAP